MTQLIILGTIAAAIFGFAYYQSYRDKKRWQRIVAGKSLFGDRDDIPVLNVAGKEFDPKDKPVLVIWSDLNCTGFFREQEARMLIDQERRSGNANAVAAKLFSWDGKSWRQKS